MLKFIQSPARRTGFLLFFVAACASFYWSSGSNVKVYTKNIVADTSGCPCTLFQVLDSPAAPKFNDNSPIEVGVRFRAAANGYITGLRFYKGVGTTGTHIGHLWSNTGLQLGEATFINESAAGWQQVSFSTPIQVLANTTYVASYFSSSGDYTSTPSTFAQPVQRGPLRALANGEDGANGVYRYTPTPAFPLQSYNASNYWVDVVFTTDIGTDTFPPVIAFVAPANGAAGVSKLAVVQATFNESIDPASVTAGSFQLKDSTGNAVPATRSTAQSQLTLTPSQALQYGARYTAVIKGGTTGVRDRAGNVLRNDYTWTFTVAGPPPPSPAEGPGGPILVVSDSTNLFSRYTVEILRAEGLNEFAAKNINAITAAELADYDVMVLGEMNLTAAQATLFTNWVNAGGTLIAFKPAVQLASLLGISPAGGSLANQYLLVNTASGPGAGIVNQTIQYHGTANLYTLAGAASLATLYSNATTATNYPAVTSRQVGSNGGRAVAFAYDLARSIVYTRQGNPAWSGQRRDGQGGPIRSDNLFFGGSEPDWVDLNKVAIPQADEQQHLLTNIILQANLHRKPLPRFWFLPDNHKAAIVMTGDDHANNGTEGRFAIYKTLGPNTPQDVADWKAVRASSYIFSGSSYDSRVTPVTNATATDLQAQGFEIALHLHTGCADFTAASFENDLSSQLANMAAQWPGLAAPVTNRNHCIAWSDWATAAKIEAKYGIRLDVNYYYWPAEWVQNRAGMFTGSGMPMRFADTDGTLIDCYQVTTQMTDESGINYTSFTNQLLDKALGPEGYYGVFCANMHTDSAVHGGSAAIIAAAQAHNVPVISARQMLTWLDGRNGSYFSSLVWNNNQLDFSVTTKPGAHHLKAMLPLAAANGQLTTLKTDGHAIAFTVETIKGVQYAFFDVLEGTHGYSAIYRPDTTAPVITNVTAVPHSDGTATISWTTDEIADATVNYGTTTGNLNSNSHNSQQVTAHTIELTGLSAGTTYYYRVISVDGSGNSTTQPVVSTTPLYFTMSQGPCAQDRTTADFVLGTTDSGTIVTAAGDGGISLKPSFRETFDGTSLPAAWTAADFTGGTTVVNNGTVTVDGMHIYTGNSFGPGAVLEFAATFTAASYQNIGFSADQPFNASPWVTIGQGTVSGNLYARSSDGQSVNLGANLTGSLHRYRIQWNTGSFDFYVDSSSTPVATLSVAVTTNMFIQVSDFQNGGGTLSVDWLQVTPYVASGTFISRVFDAGAGKQWGTVTWNSELPAGTGMAIAVRTGTTPVPGSSTWTAFIPVSTSGGTVTGSGRYAQYKAELATANTRLTPVLKDMNISCVAPGTVLRTAQPALRPTAAVLNLAVQVMPNPSQRYFNLNITGSRENVTVRVLDLYGRVQETHSQVAANRSVKVGYDLPKGVYFAEVVQGKERRLIKMIKQ